MANLCYFYLKAKGFKNDKDEKEFANVFNNNFGATENGCDDTKPYMAIYDDVTIDYLEDGVLISGDCKWSVTCSMLNDGAGYYRDYKDDNYTCLEDLSKKYGCTIEGYSEEISMEFQEHFVVDDGKLVVFEECYVEEIYFDELNWDDWCKGEYYDERITQEIFKNAIENREDYYKIGGFKDWEFRYLDNK